MFDFCQGTEGEGNKPGKVLHSLGSEVVTGYS